MLSFRLDGPSVIVWFCYALLEWSFAYQLSAAHEEFKPSARAFQEKISSLKKAVNAASSGETTARVTTAPSTPKKRASPNKIFSGGSSSKRVKQFDAMHLNSDGDETDEGASPNINASIKSERRKTPSRRSKSVAPNYSLLNHESDDFDERIESPVNPTLKEHSETASVHASGKAASPIKLDEADILASRSHLVDRESTKASHIKTDNYGYFSHADDSDGSNFDPQA